MPACLTEVLRDLSKTDQAMGSAKVCASHYAHSEEARYSLITCGQESMGLDSGRQQHASGNMEQEQAAMNRRADAMPSTNGKSSQLTICSHLCPLNAESCHLSDFTNPSAMHGRMNKGIGEVEAAVGMAGGDTRKKTVGLVESSLFTT